LKIYPVRLRDRTPLVARLGWVGVRVPSLGVADVDNVFASEIADFGAVRDIEEGMSKQDFKWSVLDNVDLKVDTLGTRTQIPTRHILDTLGAQTTSDSNVPSGYRLGTL